MVKPITFVTILAAGDRELRLEPPPVSVSGEADDWAATLALVDKVVGRHREGLVAGAHIIELGCGMGLPGLVCAAFGAQVMLTDLPEVNHTMRRNAALNFNGCNAWEVIGGAVKGGIPATKGRSTGSAPESEMLTIGALVEQQEVVGERMRFERIEGAGPDAAWASTKERGPKGEPLMAPRKHMDWAGPGAARTRPLVWGASAARQVLLDEGEFDLVLCSDCVNEPMYGESWEQLVESLVVLCSPHTTVLLTVQRRLHDGVDDFLARLRSQLLVRKLDVRTGTDLAGATVDVFLARRATRGEGFQGRLDEIETPEGLFDPTEEDE